MTFKEIQELIRIFSKSGIGELNIEQDAFKIKMKSIEGCVKVAPASYSPTFSSAPIMQTPAPIAQATLTDSKDEKGEAKSETSSTQITIKAPMIGTFYRSSGPDKEPFVKVGDKIDAGSPICIIEAMKLFNEIESEVSGTVVKVLVNDATPVEYDQPLFIIEP
jgi:acetyl-CoA carboxylase biotin carboxyl carrier protein